MSTVEQRCAAEISLAKAIESGNSIGCVPVDTITGRINSRSIERAKPAAPGRATLTRAARRRVKNLKD